MKNIIKEGKYVELIYKIIDAANDDIVAQVDIPLGYVHGEGSQLFPQVTQELDAKSVGDKIEVPIDCNDMFGQRDEGLVFVDDIKNVPEQYQKIGAKITMENDKKEPKEFFVTKIEDGKLTVDGNNPLCGKSIIFTLEILLIRDASDEEIEAGGAVEPELSPNTLH